MGKFKNHALWGYKHIPIIACKMWIQHADGNFRSPGARCPRVNLIKWENKFQRGNPAIIRHNGLEMFKILRIWTCTFVDPVLL